MARLAAGAFSAERAAFARAAFDADARAAAMSLAIIAGLSEVAGQSVILVANRVPLYRLAFSLVLTALLFPIMALVWTASALIFAQIADPALAMGQWRNAPQIAGVVALALAPRLLGALTIAPYYGPGLGRLIDIWVMALVIFGLQTALDAPAMVAAFAGVAGWIAQYALRRLGGRILRGPLRRLRIAVTGSALDKSPQEIIDAILHPPHTDHTR
jgi:hypothetical protein